MHKPSRKYFDTRMSIEVIGYERFQQIRQLFHAEYPKTEDWEVALVGVGSVRDGVKSDDVYSLYVNTYGPRKPTTEVVMRYTNFLRGCVAASYYYNPIVAK